MPRDLWVLLSPSGEAVVSTPVLQDALGLEIGGFELVHIGLMLGRISLPTARALEDAIESGTMTHAGYRVIRHRVNAWTIATPAGDGTCLARVRLVWGVQDGKGVRLALPNSVTQTQAAEVASRWNAEHGHLGPYHAVMFADVLAIIGEGQSGGDVELRLSTPLDDLSHTLDALRHAPDELEVSAS